MHIYISYIFELKLWSLHIIAFADAEDLLVFIMLRCSASIFLGLQIPPPYFSWETDPTDDTWRCKSRFLNHVPYPHIGIFSLSYLFHDQHDSQSPAGAVARSWGLFRLPEVCGEWQEKTRWVLLRSKTSSSGQILNCWQCRWQGTSYRINCGKGIPSTKSWTFSCVLSRLPTWLKNLACQWISFSSLFAWFSCLTRWPRYDMPSTFAISTFSGGNSVREMSKK